LQEGLVIAGHGRHCVVQAADGAQVLCHPRGKKNQAVVGDRVRWQPSQDEGVIETVLPRRNLLYRQDELRTKSFAANLDQVLILIAAQPEFSEHQLARALIAAQAAGIAPLIALNKSDLTQPFERAWARLAPYRRMGQDVLPLSLAPASAPSASDPAPPTPSATAALKQRLHGKVTLVLGPSGTGKSTLINRLVPGALAATSEISEGLHSGRHTTTSTRWYWIERASATALIDSPGFQEFGLHHIAPMELAPLMPDIAAHRGECRFYNCTHLHEPGCAVRAAVEAGQINASRYRIYGELFEELSAAKY
jgi:ribosome biogenesis GTPase